MNVAVPIFVGTVSERGAFLIPNVSAPVELDFRFETKMYIMNYIMACIIIEGIHVIMEM